MAGRQLKRLTVSGWTQCSYFRNARDALVGLSKIFPSKLNVDVMEYGTRDEYMGWLTETRSSLDAETHKSSPFVWMNDHENHFLSKIGGHDDTLNWCQKFVSVDTASAASTAPVADASGANAFKADGMGKGTHEYEYDLVVIGGGSGGLATGREAAKLGAKVAILDYVKPSPAGSKWGLGGTCVNVGCIPKKLMHNAAVLGENTANSAAYGWTGTDSTESTTGASFDWTVLRQNVQDHIKGLNFGYKVSLREEGITYHNKLGKFIDDHTLECTDTKGKITTITSARFVVAVGGRPQALGIPGSEHAISSDDLFMLKKSPGKTCVVGAGYVALECAGFLASLKQGDITVCVRSVLLRGFDRDIVDVVETFMNHNDSMNIQHSVLPISIVKQEENDTDTDTAIATATSGEGKGKGKGKLLVTFDNGTSDYFDTVLSARGRYMDVDGLGVNSTTDASADASASASASAGGVSLGHNNSNGKLQCINEQTNISNIYAVGDIVDGAPELTPSAIQAGRLLARRLYGNSGNGNSNSNSTDTDTVFMNYKNIATVVFTPLELGTVGITEEEAILQYGTDSIEVYYSKFQPLEWSLIPSYYDLRCMSKVIVDKEDNERVLGMHIAAPNAGEIIQGFGVAFRSSSGLYYRDLLDTVGIHPTIAEEFTDMTVTKSSGVDAEKKGC